MTIAEAHPAEAPAAARPARHEPAPPGGAAPEDDPRVPSLGQVIAVSVLLMTVGFVGGLTAIVWAITGSAVVGIAVGGFCAFWGGPGFGIMAGSAVHSLLLERAARRTDPSAD